MLTPWKESYDQPRQHIKKQRHYFVNKGPSSQGYSFSSSHVWMWELDYKESWAQKNWWFWTVVLEKTLESPLGCKEIQLVHPKGDESWVFIGRTDAEAETPILWPPDAKSWLLGPWCWERLRAGGEGDDRGWDGWMASLTRWTRVWVNSGSWWWTVRPGMLQSMGPKESDTSEQLNWYLRLSPRAVCHHPVQVLSTRYKNYCNKTIQFDVTSLLLSSFYCSGNWLHTLIGCQGSAVVCIWLIWTIIHVSAWEIFLCEWLKFRVHSYTYAHIYLAV